jgi:hypothetical protein
MARICFVISQIGNMGSKVRQDADDFMKYIVEPCDAFKEYDYEKPKRVDQLGEPGRITTQIIKLLDKADLVIADLINNNPNVYYELCLRHALGKPVIHMATTGTTLPFDVADNRTIFYTMHSRDAEIARDQLAKQIETIHSAAYKPTNPISETMAILTLERSGDPIAKVLGQVMIKIEGLTSEIDSLRREREYPPFFQPIGGFQPVPFGAVPLGSLPMGFPQPGDRSPLGSLTPGLGNPYNFATDPNPATVKPNTAGDDDQKM